MFFHLSNLLGGTYEHPIRDKISQDLPRRVAKFRENRHRDVEKSVMGIKKDKTKMPNVMAALPNIGGGLCSTPQTLAHAHY